MNLIYCRDEKSKDKLIKEGFKFINEQIIDGKQTWVFENSKNINFDRQVNKKLVYF